jgi:hypothetical protein
MGIEAPCWRATVGPRDGRRFAPPPVSAGRRGFSGMDMRFICIFARARACPVSHLHYLLDSAGASNCACRRSVQ